MSNFFHIRLYVVCKQAHHYIVVGPIKARALLQFYFKFLNFFTRIYLDNLIFQQQNTQVPSIIYKKFHLKRKMWNKITQNILQQYAYSVKYWMIIQVCIKEQVFNKQIVPKQAIVTHYQALMKCSQRRSWQLATYIFTTYYVLRQLDFSKNYIV